MIEGVSSTCTNRDNYLQFMSCNETNLGLMYMYQYFQMTNSLLFVLKSLIKCRVKKKLKN